MDNSKQKFYPFAYEFGGEEKFESFLTQRKAEYKEPAEEVYNNKHLEDKELLWEAFRENIEPPTPQIKEVDGYKSEKEISSDNTDDGGEGNEDGGENTPTEDEV